MDLIAPTDRGLYCAAGDFHIDPWRAVPRARHHACPRRSCPLRLRGLCLPSGDRADPQKAPRRRRDRDGRLWRDPDAQRRRDLLPPGRPRAGVGADPHRPSRRSLGRVRRLQARERRRLAPPSSLCAVDAFITESTFGLPIYRWRPQAETFAAIDAWWRENAAAGRASVLYAYALGKAQRLLEHVDPRSRPDRLPRRDRGDQRALSRGRRRLAADAPRERDRRKRDFARALILAPPSAAASPWLKRFGDYSDALASGWMQVRGNRRRRGLDRGFALSDHADWPGLLPPSQATGRGARFSPRTARSDR